VHVVQRDMISALECQLLERELVLERRTIEFRAIERCADELERRLQGRGALKTACESLEIDGISVFATGPIHFATAHATATATATANGAIAANGATAAKAATAANAAEVVEDEGSRRVRIDKMRALHGLCPYWYPLTYGDQRQSEAIRGYQRQSEAIRDNQRQREAIRGNQRRSEAIRGDQR
jgi:hypothetical protein